jgi:hypothetical protein
MGLSEPMTYEIVEICMPVSIYGLWCGYIWPHDMYDNIVFMLLIKKYLDICKLRDSVI